MRVPTNTSRDEEIIRRRQAGEWPSEIWRSMKVNRNIVSGVLFRANLTDAKINGKVGPYTPRGEAHGNAKLTEADVREMRARFVYNCPENGYRALARDYRCHEGTVRYVVNGITWKHVK